MTKKMLKFVDLKKETPPKRETKSRKKDFNEIYNEFISDKAKEQQNASRGKRGRWATQGS